MPVDYRRIIISAHAHDYPFFLHSFILAVLFTAPVSFKNKGVIKKEAAASHLFYCAGCTGVRIIISEAAIILGVFCLIMRAGKEPNISL